MPASREDSPHQAHMALVTSQVLGSTALYFGRMERFKWESSTKVRARLGLERHAP